MSLRIVLTPIALPVSLATEKHPHSTLIPLARACVIAKIKTIFIRMTKIVAPSTITPTIRHTPAINSTQGSIIANRFSIPNGKT